MFFRQSALNYRPIGTKLASFVKYMSGARGVNFQANPSNGKRDTVEKYNVL